jgi:hypothetical protein
VLFSALCNKLERSMILSLLDVQLSSQNKKRPSQLNDFCGVIQINRYMKESFTNNIIVGKENNTMLNIFDLLDSYCDVTMSPFKMAVVYTSISWSLADLMLPSNCWNTFSEARRFRKLCPMVRSSNWFNKGYFSISSISSNQGNNSFVVQIRTSAAVFTRELPGEGSEEDLLKAFIYNTKWCGIKSAKKNICPKQLTVYDLDYMYVGDICDGEEHGQGTRTAANGTVYVGEWRNGFMEGYGTMVDAEDGTRYTGEWLNHCRQGLGEMVYCDGSKYVGEWNRDQPRHNPNNCLAGSGGTMTYADGSQYSGGWEWGFRNGDGQMIYADGSKYVGMWNYDRRWGEEMIEVDGSKYKCCGWLADKHSGHYEMSYSDDGSEYNTGGWCRNQCVCKCKK